jgi:hypothetical protein
MIRGIFVQIAVTGPRVIILNNPQSQLLVNCAMNAKQKKLLGIVVNPPY